MEGLQCQHPVGCQDRREGTGVSREVKVLWEDVEKVGNLRARTFAGIMSSQIDGYKGCEAGR